VCRALRLLCGAPTPDRLLALRRAATTVSWEVVGSGTTAADLERLALEVRPDVVVLDGLGADVIAVVRRARPGVRVVTVAGPDEGADADSPTLEGLREAILGVPGPGGPVRT